MSKKPFILLTNDDGISAIGIHQLWLALRNHFDIAIVAPLSERSGASVSISLSSPLHVKPYTWESATTAYSVSGTPADCVKIALTQILSKTPDLIISGINAGSNAGRNVLYSGTIGAIIEGTFRNINGIAFSYTEMKKPEFDAIEKYIYSITNHILKNPLPQGTFLNVTFPHHPAAEIKGLKMAKQGKGYWIDNLDKRLHPEGHPYYWLGGKWSNHEEEADSDIFLLEKGFVTAVPIHVNELTDLNHFQTGKQVFEKLFENTPVL